MEEETPTIKLHLWIESRGRVVFGPGRAQLLRKIEEYGCLRKAAEDLGMSYRAAWGKIRRSEEALGFKLIEKVGSNKQGYTLTEPGRVLQERFRAWCLEIEKDAAQKAREVFSWQSPEQEPSKHSYRK
jgi:molybdate transport system regulatory protein